MWRALSTGRIFNTCAGYGSLKVQPQPHLSTYVNTCADRSTIEMSKTATNNHIHTYTSAITPSYPWLVSTHTCQHQHCWMQAALQLPPGAPQLHACLQLPWPAQLQEPLPLLRQLMPCWPQQHVSAALQTVQLLLAPTALSGPTLCAGRLLCQPAAGLWCAAELAGCLTAPGPAALNVPRPVCGHMAMGGELMEVTWSSMHGQCPC